MKSNNKLVLKVFFASIVDLVTIFLLQLLFIVTFSFINHRIYDWVEYPKYVDTSLAPGEEIPLSLITSLWYDFGFVFFTLLFFFSVLVLNRLSSGFWLRKSLGKKLFEIEVSANDYRPTFFRFLLLARFCFALPFLMIVLIITDPFGYAGVLELVCSALLIWLVDFYFVFLGKGKQLRDYILGTQLKRSID